MTAKTADAPVWVETTYALLHPIPREAPEIFEIKIFEPDAEALERIEALGMTEAKQPTVAQTRGFIEALAGLPDGALKKLHHKDMAALADIAGPLVETAMG